MNRVDYKLLHDKVEQQILRYLSDHHSWYPSLGGYRHDCGAFVYITNNVEILTGVEGFEITTNVKMAIRELFREIKTDIAATKLNAFLRKWS